MNVDYIYKDTLTLYIYVFIECGCIMWHYIMNPVINVVDLMNFCLELFNVDIM
jgi:hypothetical protein